MGPKKNQKDKVGVYLVIGGTKQKFVPAYFEVDPDQLILQFKNSKPFKKEFPDFSYVPQHTIDIVAKNNGMSIPQNMKWHDALSMYENAFDLPYLVQRIPHSRPSSPVASAASSVTGASTNAAAGDSKASVLPSAEASKKASVTSTPTSAVSNIAIQSTSSTARSMPIGATGALETWRNYRSTLSLNTDATVIDLCGESTPALSSKRRRESNDNTGVFVADFNTTGVKTTSSRSTSVTPDVKRHKPGATAVVSANFCAMCGRKLRQAQLCCTCRHMERCGTNQVLFFIGLHSFCLTHYYFCADCARAEFVSMLWLWPGRKH